MTGLITGARCPHGKLLLLLKHASSSSWDACNKQDSKITPVLPGNQQKKVMCVLNWRQ